MADTAMIFRWGAPYVGREEMSLKVFTSVLQYHGGLKAKGEIEDFHVYIDETGNLTKQGGTLIVEGTAEQIAKLRETDEFTTHIMQANHVATDFTINMTYTGNKVMERIEKLQMIRKDLGI
jgi:hypothetical protein